MKYQDVQRRSTIVTLCYGIYDLTMDSRRQQQVERERVWGQQEEGQLKEMQISSSRNLMHLVRRDLDQRCTKAFYSQISSGRQEGSIPGGLFEEKRVNSYRDVCCLSCRRKLDLDCTKMFCYRLAVLCDGGMDATSAVARRRA